MNIKRNLNIDGNYNTQLYNLLYSLTDDITLYHLEHELREPKGIYTVSTSRVFKAFENFLITFNNKNDYERIDSAHKELLDSLMAFIDDTYLVMKCFYPEDAVKKKIIFANKWIRELNKDVIDVFQKDIEPFRSRLALIVNKTKHNHARYCHVEVSCVFGKVRGYYIEGINHEGVILPNRDIHPKWRDMYTAISYNKDIKQLWVDFYCLSSLAAIAVNRIIESIYGQYLAINSCGFDGNEKLLNLSRAINRLPNLFFVDEYELDIPQIEINNNEIDLRSQAYKSFLKKLPRYDNFKAQSIMSGDGSSRSWALPYF